MPHQSCDQVIAFWHWVTCSHLWLVAIINGHGHMTVFCDLFIYLVCLSPTKKRPVDKLDSDLGPCDCRDWLNNGHTNWFCLAVRFMPPLGLGFIFKLRWAYLGLKETNASRNAMAQDCRSHKGKMNLRREQCKSFEAYGGVGFVFPRPDSSNSLLHFVFLSWNMMHQLFISKTVLQVQK